MILELTTRLSVGAMFAAKAFLDSRTVRPTTEQIEKIAHLVQPAIAKLVLAAGPNAESPDAVFEDLIERAAAIAVGVAALVLGLNPKKPFSSN